MKNYKLVNNCRLCNSKKLRTVFDLGKSPLANSLVIKKKLKKKEEIYPLRINFCENCKHVQLTHSVSAKKMFNNYLYLTNTSEQNRAHFKKYAHEVSKKFKNYNSSILDIGSNDGTFLSFFNKKNFFRVGIDPAKNLAKFTKKIGIRQLPIFFTKKNSEIIKKKIGGFDIITANHVCAHVTNLSDFFNGVKNLLNENGVFIFEVSYLADVIKKKTFDTIYHEHSDYHSLKPLIKFVKKFDLEIFDFKLVDAQGGSIRVYVSNKGKKVINSKKIFKQITSENKKYKLFAPQTYIRFQKEVNQIGTKLRILLKKIKKKNYKIAAYGAAAKTTTFMNYFKIDKNLIEFIVDDNKLKQNKFAPFTHIPILNPKEIYKKKVHFVIILAWNYSDHIIKKHRLFLKKKGKFIIPFPKIKVIR